MSNETIVAVIVNYNTSQLVKECVQSLMESSLVVQSIVVVDNRSTKAEREILKGLPESVVVLESDENLGYGGGANLGIRWFSSTAYDYLLLLNPDVHVGRSCVERLLDAANRTKNVGIVGPLVLWMELPALVWSAGVSIQTFPKMTNRLVGYEEPSVNWVHRDPSETDAIVGCAMFLPRKMIEAIGLFDEVFFLMEEEIDYAIRAKKAGFANIIVPQAAVHHGISVSIGRGSLRQRYFVKRAATILLRKHFSFLHILAEAIATPALIVKDLYQVRSLGVVHANLVGFLDGFTEYLRDDYRPGAEPMAVQGASMTA